MKKRLLQSLNFTLALLAMNVMASCTEAEMLTTTDSSEVNTATNSIYRSAEEATDIALNAYADFFGVESRSSLSISRIKCIQNVNSRSGESDSLYYVVTFDDDKGCVVVGAKKQSNPVLAVTEKGTLDPSILSNNPAVEMFNRRASVISKAATGPLNPIDTLIQPFRKLKQVWDTLESVSFPKMVKMALKQTDPFSKFCGDYYPAGYMGGYVTGCVPVAITQIMSYAKKTNQVTLTYDGSNRVINLDWPKMIDAGSRDDLPTIIIPGFGGDDPQPTEMSGTDMIAYLAREIGHRAGCQYSVQFDGIFGVGCTPADVVVALNSMGIVNYGLSSYYSQRPSEEDGRILIMIGAQKQSENGVFEGHAFLMDGRRYLKTQLTEYTYELNVGRWLLVDTKVYPPFESDYFHLNWGWGGDCDGYFWGTLFDPNNCIEYDYGRITNDIQPHNYKMQCIPTFPKK